MMRAVIKHVAVQIAVGIDETGTSAVFNVLSDHPLKEFLLPVNPMHR